MSRVKLMAGTCFEYQNNYYIIENGYIIVDTFLGIDIEKNSKDLTISQLEWVLKRCDVIPINNFIHKEYSFRDLYTLEKRDTNITAFYQFNPIRRRVYVYYYNDNCHKLVIWKNKSERKRNAEDPYKYDVHMEEIDLV